MSRKQVALVILLAVCTCCPDGRAQPQIARTVTEETPEAALAADLQEAVSMLDRNQHRLLMHDFLPSIYASRQAMEPQSSRTRRGTATPTQILSDVEARELRAMIVGAQSGTATYNRNRTLVEITFVKKPVELIPAMKPAYVPASADKPPGQIDGLGRDLKQMLTAAAALLESGQQEEFIRSVYPLPELADLAQSDNMQRLLSRLKSHPGMTEAMVFELKAAAAKVGPVSGATAEITLSEQDKTGSDRVLKFELVENNWRFFDGGKQHRTLYRQLTSTRIGSYTIPGSQGSMILARFQDSWRLQALPTFEPLMQ
jgi:hypothetical protein